MSQGLLIILYVTLTIFGSVWNSDCVCIHLQVLISHGRILGESFNQALKALLAFFQFCRGLIKAIPRWASFDMATTLMECK